MGELPICQCGCGKLVAKKGNRFIHGHNKGSLGYIKPKLQIEPTLCECGCGLYALPENDYLAGHQTRGKEPSLSHRKKISDSKKAGVLVNLIQIGKVGLHLYHIVRNLPIK